jgi:hypothetical protein
MDVNRADIPLAELRACSTQCAMAAQASAHCMHASAHRLQWAMVCLPHSAAQPRQAAAHSAQMASMWSPPRAMEAAASRQRSAHSRSSAMQCAMGLGLASWRQAVAHCRQAAAHSLHAFRHASWMGLDMVLDMGSLQLQHKLCRQSLAAWAPVGCASTHAGRRGGVLNRAALVCPWQALLAAAQTDPRRPDRLSPWPPLLIGRDKATS